MPAPSHGLLDSKSIGILYMIKLYRVMVFWVALFVLDKTYQARYVESVYVAHLSPPELRFLPLYAIAAESAFFLLIFLMLVIMERRFKNSENSFMIDETLLWQIIVDYVLSTATITLLALIVAHVVSSCGNGLRYNHDGLRAIRATSRMIFYVSVVILLLPFFVVY